MSYPSNSESVAQDQIKAFVERILRMREEAKAINDDIREIYAEAKGNGFDKTILGKLVLYVEKRQKDADAVAESESLFDLYLAAWEGESGTRVATHTHEKFSKTGGHTLDQGEGASAPALSPSNRVAKASAGNAVNATTQGSERAEPQDWNGGDGAGEASRASEGAGSSLAPIYQADPDKPAEVETSAAPVAPGKRSWTFTDKAHADCLNPEQCGGFSNLGLCTACKTAAGVAA